MITKKNDKCKYYSKNFSTAEMFSSQVARLNNINNAPTPEIQKNLEKLCKKILQPIRDKWGKPLFVSSGYRCEALNKKVGGSKTSQHLYGEAADIIPFENFKYDVDEVDNLFKLIVDMIDADEITVGQLLLEQKDDGHGGKTRWIHISLPNKKWKNYISWHYNANRNEKLLIK